MGPSHISFNNFLFENILKAPESKWFLVKFKNNPVIEKLENIILCINLREFTLAIYSNGLKLFIYPPWRFRYVNCVSLIFDSPWQPQIYVVML